MFEVMLGGSNEPKVDSMFIREVPASEFITGAALASRIGLTAGTSQHSDAGWLLFEDTVDGKTKYISKKPLRHSISWDQINTVGAVSGTAQVIINGNTYKVRLLKGIVANTLVGAPGGYDHSETHGCEWNRLLYRISAKPFANAYNTLASEGITEGDWASYGETEIGMALSYLNGEAGYGSYQWCQETNDAGNPAVVRGASGVSNLNQRNSLGEQSIYGWRPVLELVE